MKHDENTTYSDINEMSQKPICVVVRVEDPPVSAAAVGAAVGLLGGAVGAAGHWEAPDVEREAPDVEREAPSAEGEGEREMRPNLNPIYIYLCLQLGFLGQRAGPIFSEVGFI